jgi:hypothetical protein
MDYTVDVAIGDWSMTSDSRAPEPDAGAGVWTLDDLRYSWSAPGDEWPAQPDPATASIKIGALDEVLLPPLDIGTGVSFVVTGYYEGDPTPYPVARFDGRISDASARTRGDGLAVEVTAVDYTADLREIYVAAAPWPADYPTDRLDRIMEAAGLEWGLTHVWDAFDGFRALDVDHRPVAEVLEDHLSQLAQTGGFISYADYGWERAAVFFHIASGTFPEGDPLPAGTVVWDQALLVERTASGGPLVLTAGPGGLTVEPSPTPASEPSVGNTRQIPAEVVDLDVEWRRDKGRSVNRVVVSGTFAGIFGELGDSLLVTRPTVTAEFPDVVEARGPITLAKDSTLSYLHSALKMARMYLGDRDDLEGRWGVESFRLHAHALEESGTHRLIFPLFPSAAENVFSGHAAYPAGAAVVVHGLRPAQNPAGGGRAWMAGQLVGADLTIAGGRVLVDCHLRSSIPRPSAAFGSTGTNAYDALSWAGVATVQGGAHALTSWAEVDPDLTWTDLRITRSQ